MDEKVKALKELLEILVEHPDLAERITITIKPNRIIQSNETPTDNGKKETRKGGGGGGPPPPRFLIITTHR